MVYTTHLLKWWWFGDGLCQCGFTTWPGLTPNRPWKRLCHSMWSKTYLQLHLTPKIYCTLLLMQDLLVGKSPWLFLDVTKKLVASCFSFILISQNPSGVKIVTFSSWKSKILSRREIWWNIIGWDRYGHTHLLKLLCRIILGCKYHIVRHTLPSCIVAHVWLSLHLPLFSVGNAIPISTHIGSPIIIPCNHYNLDGDIQSPMYDQIQALIVVKVV